MMKHIETFNGLITTAKIVGLEISETERCQFFMDSLPASYKMMINNFRNLPDGKCTWISLRALLNKEIKEDSNRAARDLNAATALTASLVVTNNGRGEQKRGRGGWLGNPLPALPSNLGLKLLDQLNMSGLK